MNARFMTKIYSIPQNNLYNSVSYNNDNVFARFERQMVPATKSVVYNEAIKEKNRKKFYVTAGIIGGIASFALALASRRFRVSSLNLLDKVRIHSEELIRTTRETLANRSDVSLIDRARMSIFRGIHKVANSAINLLGNIDAGKNYITGKATTKVPVLGTFVSKANDKLRPFFTGTVKKACLFKYKGAEKAASQLQSTLDDVVRRSPGLQASIGNYGDDLARSVKELSRRGKFERRVDDLSKIIRKSVKEYNSEIDRMVSGGNKLNQTAESLVSRTISLDIARSNLVQHNARIADLKRIISFTPREREAAVRRLIKEITVNGKNPDPALIKKLETAFASYAKSSTSANQARVLGLLDDVAIKMNHPQLKPLVSEARKAMNTSQTGMLQDLARKLETAHRSGQISADDYKVLTKQIKSLDSNIQKAVEFEKTNLSGRWLDIEIGPSAFLETFATSLPAAALAAETIKSENNEERISKAIRYGPAVVGAGATWLTTSLMAIFGFKTLLLSAASGFAFNRIGTYFDNNYYSKGREWNTLKALSTNNTEKSGVKIFEV